MTTQYVAELGFARRMAIIAGDLTQAHFRKGGNNQRRKPDGTIVTRADIAVNTVIAQMVRNERPGERWLGEEDDTHDWGTGDDPTDRVWVCDPNDGSGLNAAGVPINLFALALVEGGKPVLGVVHDSHTGTTYHAVVGGKAYWTNSRGASGELQVNRTSNLGEGKTALFGMTVGAYDTVGLTRELLARGGTTFNTNSAVYNGLTVAMGYTVAAILPFNSPWDAAPLLPIIAGAGGKVTDLKGHWQRYDQRINGMLATNGSVHNQAVSVIGQCQAYNVDDL
ncbi:MAG TPA: inositol monophosphatase family protein [Candidatus Saccharimonas sp.]|nr:inositol monophosphatase family protein [Candidatus Saccharimonas sp.]